MDGYAVEYDAVLGVHLWVGVQWSMMQCWVFTGGWECNGACSGWVCSGA